ncbi:hypothetical protein ACFQ60_09080 [Streptomyces zhihengii]
MNSVAGYIAVSAPPRTPPTGRRPGRCGRWPPPWRPRTRPRAARAPCWTAGCARSAPRPCGCGG